MSIKILDNDTGYVYEIKTNDNSIVKVTDKRDGSDLVEDVYLTLKLFIDDFFPNHQELNQISNKISRVVKDTIIYNDSLVVAYHDLEHKLEKDKVTIEYNAGTPSSPEDEVMTFNKSPLFSFEVKKTLFVALKLKNNLSMLED